MKIEQLIFIIQRLMYFKLNFEKFGTIQTEQYIKYLTEINKILFEQDLKTNETEQHKILLDYVEQTEQRIKEHLIFIIV